MFNLVLEGIIRKLDTRGNISAKLTQVCAYADDLVFIARAPDALDEMFLTLEKEARDAGITVNQSKSKYMKRAREKGKITQQYIIGQNQFESIPQEDRKMWQVSGLRFRNTHGVLHGNTRLHYGCLTEV